MEGTVYAAIRDYYTKRAEIEKLYSENELQFEQFQVKYGLHLGPGHPSTLQPGSVPPHLGQAYNSQQRIESAHQHLPSYQAPSLYESLGSADDRTVEKESRGPTPYRYASPPGQNGLGIYEDRGDEPVELALSSPSREPDKDCQMPLLPQPGSRTTNKAGTPTKQTKLRKGTPQDGPATRYAREKKPSWYASHLENADLPTSTLSSSAIHAGLAYDPKASPTHKANETNLVKPKKKRRRMGDEVPMPECMVPPEKIRALYANGCPMKYIGEGPNPYLTEAGAVEEQDRS
ncbi:MAG: hypothetical protein L6R40_001101 [Gallowayella cf. fulva]|nr:MAG: hypothetical protein L6R40_001101 [Xanthomendoza cf. fulva]